MIPCLHFGLRHVSGRFPIEPKLASWVESGYKSPESPGPRQRGRRRDGLSRRRRGRFRSTAPYPAATNSRGVSKPRARRDNGLTFCVLSIVDNRTFKRLSYHVLDRDPTQVDVAAFCRRFRQALEARGLTVQWITTDGSTLYPEPIAAVFGAVPHQVCQFHVLHEVNKAVLSAVAQERKRL